MSMRTCTACNEVKPIADFPKNGVDKFGAVRHRPDCRECYTIARKVGKKKHRKFLSNTKHRTGESKLLTLQDWRDALLHFRGCCAYCGKKQARNVILTKEHVVPVSQGGPTLRTNIIPACTSCNCSKGDTPLLEWYLKHSGFSAERLALIKRWIGEIQ
ncbi:HNH endonuclease [compost metagenome]